MLNPRFPIRVRGPPGAPQPLRYRYYGEEKHEDRVTAGISPRRLWERGTLRGVRNTVSHRERYSVREDGLRHEPGRRQQVHQRGLPRVRRGPGRPPTGQVPHDRGVSHRLEALPRARMGERGGRGGLPGFVVRIGEVIAVWLDGCARAGPASPGPFLFPEHSCILSCVALAICLHKNTTQDKCTRDWETGISSTQPYPAGRVISTKTRPPEPKVFQREILRPAVLNKKTRLCSKCA